jgi:hypothetical protein
MGLRIEDYEIVGDTKTITPVGNNGSNDWLCLPDSTTPDGLHSSAGFCLLSPTVTVHDGFPVFGTH